MNGPLLASIVIVVGLVAASYVYLADAPISGNLVKTKQQTISQALQEAKTTISDKPIATIPASTKASIKAIPNTTTSPPTTQNKTKAPTPIQAPPVTQTTQTQSSCSENWSCSDWSVCSSDQQTRTCTDSNDCGTTKSKPTEVQSCQSQLSSGTQLEISISTNSPVIQRGSDVEITTKVTDGTNIVVGAQVELTLTYASGSTKHKNTNFTDSSGQVLWTRTIGGSSKSGIFTVLGKTSKSGYVDGVTNFAFEVVNKTI